MENEENIEALLGGSIQGLIGLNVTITGIAPQFEAEFLGIERDERGFLYVAVRRLDSYIVEGVHPSRIKTQNDESRKE